MNAGILRDFVAIQRSEIVRTSTGGQDQIFTEYWRGRANVSFTSGNQIEKNGEVVNVLTKKVKIRQISGISTSDRVVIDGRNYAILSIDKNVYDRSITMMVELIIE